MLCLAKAVELKATQNFPHCIQRVAQGPMKQHYLKEITGENRNKVYLASQGLLIQKYAKPLSGYFKEKDEQRLKMIARKFGFITKSSRPLSKVTKALPKSSEIAPLVSCEYVIDEQPLLNDFVQKAYRKKKRE